MRRLLLLLLILPTVSFADCLSVKDVSAIDTLRLTRFDPFMEVTLIRGSNGQLTEVRKTDLEDVESSYVHTLWVVKRDDGRGVLSAEYGAGMAAFDPSKLGDMVETSLAVYSGGRPILVGKVVGEVREKTHVNVGTCQYPVTVVRRSMMADTGVMIRDDALYSPDLKVALAVLQIDHDGNTTTGVYFDRIEVVR